MYWNELTADEISSHSGCNINLKELIPSWMERLLLFVSLEDFLSIELEFAIRITVTVTISCREI